ncbi:MAG: diacylglycerol kinase family lipid kinase [Christensenellaceae bacterium]|jgi:YegS/Rv2252/BmrU family lipid kinase|nr:diacylglycerol kinase family lipid kinase [Christensenellaceae bacterium]
MNKRLLLIINPNAGMKKANRHLTDIVALFNSYDYACTVYVTAACGEATRYAQALAAQHDMVVCIGGDGTLNETLSGVIDSGANVPIGYIPSGSTNDFASSLGLPRNVLTAARHIMQGKPTSLDAGSFNGRRFSYVASFGAFTEASYATSQPAKNSLGHLAYILEGMKDIPNISPVHLRLTADNTVFEEDYIFGAISNATSIGGILSMDKELVALDDGLFEITLIKSPVTLMDLNRIVVSLQSHQYDPEVIHFCQASKALVEASSSIPWTLDGEYAPGSARITIENLHNAVRILLV